MIKRLAIALILPLLVSCTLAPRDTGKAFMFGLAPVKTALPKASDGSLIVAVPETSPELDTYRIALTRDKGRWDYYAGARWSEFLPLVVQDNLTKTLERSKLFKTVTTEQTGLEGDLILKTEIRMFQAEYEPGAHAPVVKVRLVATLVTRHERNPVTSFEVMALKAAGGNRLSEIQSAFRDAFNDTQKQLVGRLKIKLMLKQD